MDIEGFEYGVIRGLGASGIRPDHLLVEFHHGMYQSTEQDTFEAVETLKSLGYGLFFVSDVGLEYGFIRESEDA
jgi:hypothetical protein